MHLPNAQQREAILRLTLRRHAMETGPGMVERELWPLIFRDAAVSDGWPWLCVHWGWGVAADGRGDRGERWPAWLLSCRSWGWAGLADFRTTCRRVAAGTGRVAWGWLLGRLKVEASVHRLRT